jgi:hypothetical protein
MLIRQGVPFTGDLSKDILGGIGMMNPYAVGYPGGVLPPYPGNAMFNAFQDYNPAIGNTTTNPYINGLFDSVNAQQDFIYMNAGVGFPPLGGTGGGYPMFGGYPPPPMSPLYPPGAPAGGDHGGTGTGTNGGHGGGTTTEGGGGGH